MILNPICKVFFFFLSYKVTFTVSRDYNLDIFGEHFSAYHTTIWAFLGYFYSFLMLSQIFPQDSLVLSCQKLVEKHPEVLLRIQHSHILVD